MKHTLVLGLLCIPLALFGLLVSVSFGTINSEEAKVQLVLGLLLTLWFALAGVLFLSGLRDFARQAKHSYYFICAGAVTMGLTTVGLPLGAILFGGWHTTMFIIITACMSTLAMGLIYSGVRLLAHVIDLKHWATSPTVVAVLGVLIACAVVFLPHPTGTEYAIHVNALSYDVLYIARMLELLFGGLVVLLVLALRPLISPAYNRGLVWIALFSLLDSLTVALSTVSELFLPPVDMLQNIILLAVILRPLMLIRAAHVFSLMYIQKKPKEGRPGDEVSIVDVVLYAASLATRPKDIDPILDNLRDVTARLQPGEKPTTEDAKRLGQTYLAIEQYLLHKEPVLGFTQSSLRGKIELRFSNLTNSFWLSLSSSTKVSR